MEINKKKIFYILFVVVVAIAISALGITLTKNIGKSSDQSMYEKAKASLEKMVRQIEPTEVSLVKSAIEVNDSNNSVFQELPDIESNSVVVQPTTNDYLEIFCSPEKSGSGTDAWLTELSESFNAAGGAEVGGVRYSIKLRSVSSGQALDYIASKKAVPDAYSPSSDLWVDMLNDDGVNTIVISESLVKNNAGLCISNDKYDDLKSKYGKVDFETVIKATVDGQIKTGYTNPFTSSAGLNLLVSSLYENGGGNVFSFEAEEGFKCFQNNVPYVALTTQQMNKSASKGTFDAFVSEYQTYINDSDMSKKYKFVPYGYEHNNPLVAVTTDNNKIEALKIFSEFCSTDASKKLANEFGFNNDLSYSCAYNKISGKDLRKVQQFYKDNKDADPVICVFVTDVSGSMVGEPIKALKSSLVNAMQYINPKNYIGLVSYSDDVEIRLPIGEFNIDQQSYFKGAVESLSPFGGTATIDGVLVALDMVEKQLEKTPDAKAMIFVLSDGATNEGYSVTEATDVIKGLKIPVYTIGYNADIDALKEISDINEGTCINADTDDIMYQIKMLFNSSL